MSLISKSINDIKWFFDKKMKWLNKELNKEANEIEELETNIVRIKTSKSINDGWSDHKMIKFWIFALLIGLMWYFVFNLLNVIFLIIWSYIMSMIVESLIWWLEKMKMNRWFAVILSYLIFLIFMLWILVFVVPFLFAQMAELITVGLNYVSWVQENLATNWLSSMIMNIKFLPIDMKEYFISYLGNSEILIQIQNVLQNNLSQIVSVWQEYVQLVGVAIVWFISWFTTFLINFGLFLTLAILFSIEKDSVMKFVANLWWSDYYDLTYLKLEKMYKKLAIWLNARLVLSLFVAVAMWLALWVMSWFGVEIPNKVWLAIMTWLLDIIPYIWPFVSAVLLFVVWLLYNTLAVAVLAVWILFGINLLQNNILTPLFMNKALWVNSVLILISMILGWMIMWFLWVLLAVPIAVIITLLFQNRDKLESDEDIVEEVDGDVKKEFFSWEDQKSLSEEKEKSYHYEIKKDKSKKNK